MSECDWATGRLRAGPFAVADKAELLDLMAAHGIHLSDEALLEDEDPKTHVEVKTSRNGCTLIATGMAVRAYFVDDEGLEVAREQLEDFLIEAVAPNARFSINGRPQATPTAVTLSSVDCHHDGRDVFWSESRLCNHADGRDMVLVEPTPSPLNQILSMDVS